MSDIEAFLDDRSTDTPKRACSTCIDEPVARAIVALLDAKQAGDTRALRKSWTKFHQLYLEPTLGYQLSVSGMIRHIRECLKRDARTGKPFVDPEAD